jgi:ubiquitin carboxyl-terminal hydrolase 34
MKIDTDPTTPHTPEQQTIPGTTQSEPRSSRVTINVRTPSRPLEVIPSSPPPSKDSVTIAPPIPDSGVKVSVEESEHEGHLEDSTVDTPGSSASHASSPPVELVSIQPDIGDDANDFADAGEPPGTLFRSLPQVVIQDPAASFPFRDTGESFLSTIERLMQYIQTRACLLDTHTLFLLLLTA